MKLQTKLGLALLPVIFLTVSFLGFWSIRTVGQELETANSRYMRKVLDSYTEDTVAAHYSLLEKNALQNVESFVTAYQQKAFEAAGATAEAEGGHFLIFDGTGKIQSMTRDLDPGREGQEWEDAYPVIQTALSGNRPGKLKTSEGSELFVVRRFSPWDWTILFSIHESSILRVKREIAEVTLILTAVSLAVCSLVVLLILQRFFVRPVGRLSAAADYIAENKDSYRIGISSRDEIGGLSRTMEDLSDAIGVYRRELTEWNRQLEEKIKERTRDLERSNAELEQFAYVASHDLQEPLRSVSGFLQLLEKRYETELDEDALRYIQRAVGASRRMQEMIQSLLAYSRIGTKGQPFRDVDCNEVVRKVLENLKDAVTRENADVSCGPLPVVPGDEIQLIQLFQNLVSNALKYNKETIPEVRIRAEEREREWLFAVEDNGIGIDPRFSDRIFQIFQRLHGRTEYSGTGIGLAVCRKIVERHNGEIWAEPGTGSGSVFRFTLPGQEERTMNRTSDEKLLTILLVEDNPDDIELTRESLKMIKMALNLEVAMNGDDALRFLRKRDEYAEKPTPDLILLDLNLPGVNGREVLAEIKSDEALKMIPVVILTTSTSDQDIVNAYNLHANCYITKPVDLDQFIKVVHTIRDFWFTVVKLPEKDRNSNE